MKKLARILVLALILLALGGCNLPVPGADPTPLPEENIIPAVSVGPLAPAVVETAPMNGSRIAAAGEIDLYFNQPMDRTSVESAIAGSPALNGSFTWVDDLHLVFKPAQPWPVDSAQEFTLGAGARSQEGLALEEPYQWRYQTAGYLRLVQELPEDLTKEIDPESAIVASFNQPVVPLGAASDLPPGFHLIPEAKGRGEWLNTSTYIFYPNPSLVGGVTYTASLNQDLISVDGSPMESGGSWKFTTLPPGYQSYSPQLKELHVRLDAPVKVTFNQAMNPDSVEAVFWLVDQQNQPVAGEFSWSDDLTSLTFQPNSLLKRGEMYSFGIPSGVESVGGALVKERLDRYFYAAMELFVLKTTPENGGTKQYYSQVTIDFNAPLDIEDPADYITIEPDLKVRVTQGSKTIRINGDFEAEKRYTVTVNSGVKDAWGDELGYEHSFSFTGSPQDASFRPATYQGGGIMFVNPDDPLVSAQVVNVDQASILTGGVSLEQFLYIEHNAPQNERDQYLPEGLISNIQTLEIERNRNQVVGLQLNGGKSLSPGVYWVWLDAFPSLTYHPGRSAWTVVSHVQMVFKVSAADALVWAVDTRTGKPVNDQPVRILDRSGSVLASGVTDGTGLFTADLPAQETYYGQLYAELGHVGEDLYSLALSTWDSGVSGRSFGYYNQLTPPQNSYYVYTDRPIYRPGQEVSFKVIVREEFNGRYSLPELSKVELKIRDGSWSELETIVLPLSEFGTVDGTYLIPAGAEPGYFDIVPADTYEDRVIFQVANYRKPEIDIDLAFEYEDVLAGDQLNAEVSSRYYFDAPVSGSEIGWNLYTYDSYFRLPGYYVGPSSWTYSSYRFPGGSQLGEHQIGGSDVTGEDGRFAVSVASEESNETRVYTLETVVMDESGMTVSNRTTTTVHPEVIYIGISPDSWVGQAGTEMIFDVRVVDWEKRPAGVQNLTATFGEVTWELSAPNASGFTSYEKHVNVLSQGDFQTTEAGLARPAFTPKDPGVYQLTVTSGNAITELQIWVGGPGIGVWPDREKNQLELLVDKESYSPGEVATVFVPNPFPSEALALVTYERGEIMENKIFEIEGSGMSVPVVLTDESVPNIYFTVTVMGMERDGELNFRYGMVNLKVEPEAYLLQVEVVGQPERTAPGEPVLMTIRVSDKDGNPVQGEFSLAVVDEAVLALADRFEEPIEEAFYGESRLGVLTGISLTADAELYFDLPGGLGGGGGDQSVSPTRTDFEDTAYWNAVVTTGPDGRVSVEVALPDNLTTWQLLARGLSADNRVGEGISRVITTKPLLVRPVTPRFVVAGDQLELAAVAHNNTDESIEATVGLNISGFELDDPASAQQTVSLPAGGSARISWSGTVSSAEVIEAVFAIEGGGYQDASTPVIGDIPIVGYLAPQAFVTAGVLDQGGERLELVSLPRSFYPNGGELRLEMASSLAGVALDGLEVIEVYENVSTEYLVSSFLPNIEMLKVIQEFGLDDMALYDRLDENIYAALNQLQAAQNYNGGWGWYPRINSESNPILTAYVLLGLTRADEMGYPVREYVINNGRDYLTNHLYTNTPEADWTWEYERDVFVHYVLKETGTPMFQVAENLAEGVEHMSPWSRALFGLVIANGSNATLSDTIFSDLQSTAVRSASGMHWANQPGYWVTLSSDVVNNAIVIYALAQQNPASPVVGDAVRYMMSHRDANGGWGSSYGTAWSLMALTEVMRGTGELGGEFNFSATLNENPFATGEAGGVNQFTQVVAETDLQSLLPDLPNALTIKRDPGQGRLYYRANLNVIQQVSEIAGMNRGIGVSRAYYLAGQDCAEVACAPVTTVRVGDLLTVRVTLNLDQPLHYVQVADYIPAGTEVLDRSLNTTQLGVIDEEITYSSEDSKIKGWGWWYFGATRVYDDHVTWAARYLPEGTYEVTYTLVVTHPGVFQARPAQAQQLYFPEVQGISAGDLIEVKP